MSKKNKKEPSIDVLKDAFAIHSLRNMVIVRDWGKE